MKAMPVTIMAMGSFHFTSLIWPNTKHIIKPVIVIDPVTAMPYAAARFSDLWKNRFDKGRGKRIGLTYVNVFAYILYIKSEITNKMNSQRRTSRMEKMLIRGSPQNKDRLKDVETPAIEKRIDAVDQESYKFQVRRNKLLLKNSSLQL